MIPSAFGSEITKMAVVHVTNLIRLVVYALDVLTISRRFKHKDLCVPIFESAHAERTPTADLEDRSLAGASPDSLRFASRMRFVTWTTAICAKIGSLKQEEAAMLQTVSRLLPELPLILNRIGKGSCEAHGKRSRT